MTRTAITIAVLLAAGTAQAQTPKLPYPDIPIGKIICPTPQGIGEIMLHPPGDYSPCGILAPTMETRLMPGQFSALMVDFQMNGKPVLTISSDGRTITLSNAYSCRAKADKLVCTRPKP